MVAYQAVISLSFTGVLPIDPTQIMSSKTYCSWLLCPSRFHFASLLSKKLIFTFSKNLRTASFSQTLYHLSIFVFDP
jgi:hypothetical protein